MAGLGTPCLVVDVTRGQSLPADGYGAVVVTGSPSMVTERQDWSEATAVWLRQQPEEMPMLGVCYGHQLLAHAFGGVVGDNPAGRQIGTIEVTLTAAGGDHLTAQLPTCFKAQASHYQSVLALPPGAQAIASSPRDPNHIIRFRPRVWGVQFHPEWTQDITQGYLLARRQMIEQEGQNVDELLATTAQSTSAAAMLRQFASLSTID